MEFYCYETRERVRAKHRPLVFITSNNEKELPDAFLRRCFFHYIRFPDEETMKKIVDVHFPGLHAGLLMDPSEVNDTQTLIHDHDIVLRNRYAGPLTIVGHIALAAPAWFAGDGETTEELAYGEERPLPETGIICIDTGCGKGGKMSGMVIDNSQFIIHNS